MEDLHAVLVGYRQRLESTVSKDVKIEDIFGNMEEIFEFHSQYLLPDLGRCRENSRMIAKIFLEYSQDMRKMYCRFNFFSYHANIYFFFSVIVKIWRQQGLL